MKHFEVVRQWCKKIEIEIFDKWLISLDHVTYLQPNRTVFCICFKLMTLYIPLQFGKLWLKVRESFISGHPVHLCLYLTQTPPHTKDVLNYSQKVYKNEINITLAKHFWMQSHTIESRNTKLHNHLLINLCFISIMMIIILHSHVHYLYIKMITYIPRLA